MSVTAIYDVPAPAKLNLFLHVRGRRPDGYHEIESAFMLIDWCDTLHFERRSDGLLSREDLGEPLPADDLVLRAARALKAASGTPLGAHIGIQKTIPTEAGLGGGSSDAASCLLALARLWRLDLPLSEIARIGLTLGADVPFFLGGRNAWVEGIGERLTPIALPPARFVVLKPRQGLPTRDIFESADLPRNTAAAIMSGFAAAPWTFGQNDLQAVARRLCPELDEALHWLASRGFVPRMTGSGSAVFAPVPEDSGGSVGSRRIVAGELPAGFVLRECGNLETHPLAGWVS